MGLIRYCVSQTFNLIEGKEHRLTKFTIKMLDGLQKIIYKINMQKQEIETENIKKEFNPHYRINQYKTG